MVVGLGNPGDRYVRTRHNVGFAVVDRLATRWGIDRDGRQQHGALVASGAIAQHRSYLVRPQTYMNRSGQPVASLTHYYKVPLEQVVVVHDDLDLPFGTIRCKRGGGAGGHNGLRDLDRHITRDYARVRVGIGRPPAGWQGADYVLGRWTPEQAAGLSDIVDKACDAVETVITDGLEAAMNRFHARPAGDRRRKRSGATELSDARSSTVGSASSPEATALASRSSDP